MATSFAVDLVFKSKGEGKIKEATEKLRGVDDAAKKAGRSTAQAANGVRLFGRSAAGAAGGVRTLGAAIQAALGPLAIAGGAVSALTAAFQTLSTQDFAEAKVRTLGVNSKDLVNELKAVSAELKGQASVVELTAAAYDVASAGFNNAADAAKVLKAASLGATGGFSDINTVGNAVTSVLNAYGLSAENAAGLVDKFVQTQNDGKIVVAQYAAEIGKVASVAAGLKVPLDEVNAVIAQATAAGVKSEVAFTGLKTALAQLASGQATERMKELGLNIDAGTIAADGLAGTFKKIKDSGADVGQVLKLLGTEAGPALAPVLNDLEKFDKLLKKQADSTGVAKKAALEASMTIQGAFKALQTTISNFFSQQTGLGQLLGGALALVNQALSRVAILLNLGLAPLNQLVGLISKLVIGGMQLRDAFVEAFQQNEQVQKLAQLFQKIGGYINRLGEPIKQFFVDRFKDGLKIVQQLAGFIAGALFNAVNGVVQLIVRLGSFIPGLKNEAKALGEAWEKIKNFTAETTQETKKNETAVKRTTSAAELMAQAYEKIGSQLRLNAAKTVADQQLSVANAMYDAFLKVNDLELQRAKNAGNVKREYELTLKRAELVYQQSLLQIKAEEQKAKFAALQAKIELKKLEAATALKEAKGEAVAADYEALALQKQAVELAWQGVEAAQQIAGWQMQGASAVRQMAIEQAKYNQAASAGRQLSGGGGGGASGGGTTVSGSWVSSDSVQAVARRLSAAGVTGAFSYEQAVGKLNEIASQQRSAYQQEKAALLASGKQPGFELDRKYGFASGGFVNGPTSALIGEGGEAEYVIPSSKMAESVKRYSQGARGPSVVPGGIDAATGAASGSSYSSENNTYVGGGGNQINVTTGPVMRLGNKNYVSMSDMQRGLAAAVGAAEANMMSRVNRSYAARRGMGL